MIEMAKYGKDGLLAGLAAGGAPVMWERILDDALPSMGRLVPSGGRVLEVGYGDGLLSCYLCRELGWRITGLDICPESYAAACKNGVLYGLEDRLAFHWCVPEETRRHTGDYDAVFIKTVLYNSPNLEEYAKWLDWILSVLKPGGVLINFETGRANRLVQLYRRLRRREYTNLLLYTPEVEALYDTRFEIIDRAYYGGWSQFLAPISWAYKMAAGVEEAVRERDAGNCFAVTVIGRKG
jgi:SAM-dependent methyltransferase